MNTEWDDAKNALQTVKDKMVVVEQTKAAFEAAAKDLADAQGVLAQKRQELAQIMGEVLPPSNARVY